MSEELEREYLVESHSGDLAVYWVLTGSKGSVTFHLLVYRAPRSGFYREIPIDICTHSLRPQHPDDKPDGMCEFLNWGVCYGETDGLGADAVWENVQTAPREVDTNALVWRELERRYNKLI